MAISSRAQTILNVTNFGARGDAVQFYANTTSNSVVVTTTNQLSGADVGKVIELFGAGPLGASTNHQDLLATITNVVNGTNIYMSRVARAATNNCQGIYGTNNAAALQACIDAAPSNSVINIPNGTYFLVGTQPLDPAFVSGEFTEYGTLTISKGGLTFLGQSESGTILLGNGAWQNKTNYVYRGALIGIVGPVTNSGPLVFDTLTMDGGVPVGLTPDNIYWPASTDDGSGWDVTHSAVVWSGNGPLHSQTIFRNCTVKRWRGEQIKCNVSMWDCPPPGPALIVSNCIFFGGSATALNAPLSHNYVSNGFYNLAQIEEFYEGYATNLSYYQGNISSNIIGSMIAINGALTTSRNPTYLIQNNTFYYTAQNAAGIEFLPAQNVVISSNQFIATGNNAGTAINLGGAGAQGNATVGNTVIVGNLAINLGVFISAYGSSQNTYVTNNIFYGSGAGASFIQAIGGGQTNILLYGNYASNNITVAVDFRSSSGQYPYDDLSDNFPYYNRDDFFGVTNMVSYSSGARQNIETTHSGSVWTLDDSAPLQIPPMARMIVNNTCGSTVPLYLSASMSGTPMVLKTGQMVTCLWTNGFWASIPSPPGGLVVAH